MSKEYAILTGYANGDVHIAGLLPQQDHSDAAALEMGGIGQLTNAGFRTIVASLWCNASKKTACIDFAAVWEENDTSIIIHSGDRVATSHELFVRWKLELKEPMTAEEVLTFCRRLKREP